MRVTCSTLDEFLENLEQEKSPTLDGDLGSIYRRTVYLNKIKQPCENEKNKREAVRFDVSLRVSTVINVGNEEQYLLEAQEYCGIDYHDASKEMIGSEVARELGDKLTRFCDDNGLTIRPGVVDF